MNSEQDCPEEGLFLIRNQLMKNWISAKMQENGYSYAKAKELWSKQEKKEREIRKHKYAQDDMIVKRWLAEAGPDIS